MTDQNRNSGSKQADGGSDGNVFKSKPTDKEGMGASGGSTESGDKGYAAGSRNKNEETDGEDSSGESGSGKSGSTIR